MEQDKIDQFNQAKAEQAKETKLLNTIVESANAINKTIIGVDKTAKKVVGDIARPSDIEKVVEAVKGLRGELKPKDIKPISDALKQVSDAVSKLPTKYPDFPAFPELPEQREDVKVTNLSELKEYFNDVVTAVGKLQTSIKFDPKIEVKPADVTVNEKEVDLTPVTKGLANLEKAFKSIKTPEFDTTGIMQGLKKVSDTINGLSFPVPNYVLPFKDINGNAAQVQLDANGKVPVASVGESGGVQYTEGDLDLTPTGTAMMFQRDAGTGEIVIPSDNNPLPTTVANLQTNALTDAELRATEVPVSMSGVATAAAQTDGTQKIQIVDAGGDAVTVTGGKLDVNSAAPVGGATEAKQDSQITLATQLETLTETLQELVQRLAPLAGAMNNTAQLRTVVTGAVTATGGGYITSAQAVAALLTQTNSLISSQRLESYNTLPTLANINNAAAA